MTNQITQKFIDLLGPISDDRLHFSTFSNTGVGGGHTIVEMSKIQRELAEQLLKDHFKFKEVDWIDLPTTTTKIGKPIAALMHKLSDEESTKYEGKTGYVYQITFTPKMYDPKIVHTPVKDGCTFGPLLYNPETFEPSRSITLTFNPTFPQDIYSKEDQDEIMKQSLRDKLEKVLENPNEYMPEAFRACMVRMAVV